MYYGLDVFVTNLETSFFSQAYSVQFKYLSHLILLPSTDEKMTEKVYVTYNQVCAGSATVLEIQ